MALRRIRESELPMAGRGMAIAGLIMGYLGLLFQIGIIAILVFAFSNKLIPATP